MTHPFLERLRSPECPVIVFDGAMGTNLQTQNLTAEDFGEHNMKAVMNI